MLFSGILHEFMYLSMPQLKAFRLKCKNGKKLKLNNEQFECVDSCISLSEHICAPDCKFIDYVYQPFCRSDCPSGRFGMSYDNQYYCTLGKLPADAASKFLYFQDCTGETPFREPGTGICRGCGVANCNTCSELDKCL